MDIHTETNLSFNELLHGKISLAVNLTGRLVNIIQHVVERRISIVPNLALDANISLWGNNVLTGDKHAILSMAGGSYVDSGG